jgi:hypothetical protein
MFCCHDRQFKLHRRLINRDRLPLPAGTRPDQLNGHYPAFQYYAILRLLLGHRAVVLSFSDLPATWAGTQQISRDKTQRFRRDHVANTPSGPKGIGHRCREPAHPPKERLRRFTLVRNHNASMASFRHALTEAPQRNQPHWDHPVNSGPRPCLFDVGFPLSGPQVRTSTSDLKRHALHTRWQDDCSRSHQAVADSLSDTFATDAAHIAAQIGHRALEELLTAHRLWSAWLREGRVRKIAFVTEKTEAPSPYDTAASRHR